MVRKPATIGMAAQSGHCHLRHTTTKASIVVVTMVPVTAMP
jgi:hypothetical protein